VIVVLTSCEKINRRGKHMFLIDKQNKKATPLDKKLFSEMDLREQNDFQEWIINEPTILGESLLIISKEFSGWEGTKERLDLLALDREGKLVIIENKTDDSGRDVMWQALKYASYCAALTKSDICEIYQRYLGAQGVAAEKISEFFGEHDFEEIELNSSQRIILVAAKFRPEVTSTVLFCRDFGIDISCVKVTLYGEQNRLYLDTERILPVQGIEEYQITLATKKREAQSKEAPRHNLRLRFWERVLPILREKTGIYQNVSPSKDNWIGGGSGHSGISYNVVANKKGARAELWISTGNKEKNKRIFRELRDNTKGYEHDFEWRELPENVTSIICINNYEYNIANEGQWDEIADFLGENIAKLIKVFREPLVDIMGKVR